MLYGQNEIKSYANRVATTYVNMEQITPQQLL